PARSTYAALFKLYVALYPTLKPVMHQLRQISVDTAAKTVSSNGAIDGAPPNLSKETPALQ
ncbi:MAG: hypothetical protein H7172_07295, partial [Ferruginibacter sp.]|nr:hypothetical protein [Rhodoferax sp.]